MLLCWVKIRFLIQISLEKSYDLNSIFQCLSYRLRFWQPKQIRFRFRKKVKVNPEKNFKLRLIPLSRGKTVSVFEFMEIQVYFVILICSNFVFRGPKINSPTVEIMRERNLSFSNVVVFALFAFSLIKKVHCVANIKLAF